MIPQDAVSTPVTGKQIREGTLTISTGICNMPVPLLPQSLLLAAPGAIPGSGPKPAENLIA
jgi:hypothetical protein